MSNFTYDFSKVYAEEDKEDIIIHLREKWKFFIYLYSWRSFIKI